MRGLGCWERFLAEGPLESYGTICSWGSPEPHENEFVFSARGNGWHVDRGRFDAMMCDGAEAAGVEVYRGVRLGEVARNGSAWRLATGGQEFQARFAIDSTGRSAFLATRQGARRVVDDNLIAIFMTFRFPAQACPADMRTLVEARPEGWWYSSIVPGERAVVAWMSDADLIRDMGLARDADRWLDHLRHSTLTAARLLCGQPDASPITLSAQSQRLEPVAGPGWIAAGDAAMAFDPLSSQGILKAILTGKMASFVALDFLAGNHGSVARYEATAAASYEEYRMAKATFYGMETRWLREPFWERRVK